MDPATFGRWHIHSDKRCYKIADFRFPTQRSSKWFFEAPPKSWPLTIKSPVLPSLHLLLLPCPPHYTTCFYCLGTMEGSYKLHIYFYWFWRGKRSSEQKYHKAPMWLALQKKEAFFVRTHFIVPSSRHLHILSFSDTTPREKNQLLPRTLSYRVS